MLPSLGSTPLAKLSATQIRRLLNAKLTSGLSPRSVQYIHAVLRRALNDAVRSGFLMRNVALLVDPPRAVRRNVVPMSLDETRAFMTVVHGHRLEALFVVALATGLRQGELFALRWSDVNLEDATLRVANSLQRTSGGWALVEPKSSTSRRTVALAPVAARTLRQHRDRQLEERLVAADGLSADDFVFTTPIGTPLDSSNVRRAFKALLRQAGLPDLRFHDLRHQCASLLVAQGVHPRVVMETLGHSQIAVTMNTYSHVMPHLQREAADRMEELLGS